MESPQTAVRLAYDAHMSVYLLPETVHLCRSGSQVVMLDLAKDQYLAVDSATARSLAKVVPGWPTADEMFDDDSGGPFNMEEVSSAVETMSARGLLTTDHARGKPAVPVQIAVAGESLRDEWEQEPLVIRLRHVIAFVAAATAASFALRWTTIAKVVRKTSARRISRTEGAATPDLAAARALVDVFFRLRPFFFTAHNACLFDSLALINFLARFGLHPSWIFGVQTAPFAAHCWVQHADTVFNDSVEHVRRYTPILAV